MSKQTLWATTPEAKEKLAAGLDVKTPKLNDCEKMRRAKKAAEQVIQEIKEQKEATALPPETAEELPLL